MEGHVYLTEDDLHRMAAFVGMSAADFEEKYVYRTAHQLRLRKPPERQCLFLQDKKCSIHPAKPTQCRLFPFWPEVIESAETWRATACNCPGMGKGPLVRIEDAKRVAGEMYSAYPAMYK